MAYTYSPAGRVEHIDHPDGTRTDQTFDEAGRIETIGHFRDGLREVFYAYDYDLNGNRSSQTEDFGAGEVETTYDYDRADRLVETERAGRITTYVLDAVGNRKEEIVTQNGVTTTKTFDYNVRDQLERTWVEGSLESEYAYDANGNRIQSTTEGVTREFNFGARDRLLSLNVQGSPPEVEWTYDDAGFRIAETTPSDARRFRWDGESMAFETNVLGNLLMRYDHGPDRLLAETEGIDTRTWLTDALKTPVKRLTDTGATYSVTRYDEYGEVEEETSPDIPRFGFTGHQRGPAEAPDLYYAQQRWYNAATGRFISEDPVWGEPKRPLSLHRYLYAYANPTTYIDPDGRVGYLSDLANFFDSNDQYYEQTIASEETGWLSSVGHGFLKGANALASLPVRGLNTASNIVGSALPENLAPGVKARAQQELEQRTFSQVDAGLEFGRFVADDPVGAWQAGARQGLQMTSGLIRGDRRTWAGASEFLGGSVLPGSIAVQSARTMRLPNGPDAPKPRAPAESPGGTGVADAQLERRMELIPDNDFGPINQSPRQRPNFYVNSRGEALPATGFRYMDSQFSDQTMRTRRAPGSYFGFERHSTGASARDRYQIFYEQGNPLSWSDARLRGEFNTLQLFDPDEEPGQPR